jgi:hypothetical protein
MFGLVVIKVMTLSGHLSNINEITYMTVIKHFPIDFIGNSQTV